MKQKDAEAINGLVGFGCGVLVALFFKLAFVAAALAIVWAVFR